MSRPEPEPCGSGRPRVHPARKQIRGSALLMAGRGIAVALNFAVQVVMVRYLSKLDYGAFAYALSMVTLISHFSLFGLDKAASRFAAIHLERRDHSRLFGSLLLMIATIVALGAGVTLGAFGLRGMIGDKIVSSPLSLTLLLSLIVLAPVRATDSLLQSVFAVFAKPRLIFFRKHIVGPLLKLAAVLLVIAVGGDVHLLAAAYLVAGFIGLLIGCGLLARVLRERDLLREFRFRGLTVPAREILGFSLPMMASDLVFLLRGTLVILLLEYFHSSSSVADYRAVLPVARLNRVVLESFGFLFMPAVARLLVRGESRDLNEMFWRSTTWVAVLSFPVFGLTFAFARPITLLLFGDRYAESAVILTLLSFGLFAGASVGLNTLALKASGKVRQILAIDSVAVATVLVLNLILIPRYQALGGAISFCVTAVVHALLYQVGLSRSTGIKLFPWKHLKVYAGIVLVGLALAALQASGSPPLYVAVPLVGMAWLVVLAFARGLLDVEGTFPELRRVPVVRRFLGTSESGKPETAKQP